MKMQDTLLEGMKKGREERKNEEEEGRKAEKHIFLFLWLLS
jgi:hypothetical protein